MCIPALYRLLYIGVTDTELGGSFIPTNYHKSKMLFYKQTFIKGLRSLANIFQGMQEPRIKTLRSFETSLTIYQSIQGNIPDDPNVRQHLGSQTDKLTVVRLTNKLPAFYGKFITMFKKPSHANRLLAVYANPLSHNPIY